MSRKLNYKVKNVCLRLPVEMIKEIEFWGNQDGRNLQGMIIEMIRWQMRHKEKMFATTYTKWQEEKKTAQSGGGTSPDARSLSYEWEKIKDVDEYMHWMQSHWLEASRWKEEDPEQYRRFVKWATDMEMMRRTYEAIDKAKWLDDDSDKPF